MFGWVGMPYIFQVLKRSLVALCQYIIVGLCSMYVDDIMGVSPTSQLHSDMCAADTAVTGLLGPAAIAVNKDECGRGLVWIGWYINLDNRSVKLSRRNLLKTIFAFFCFSITDKISKQQLETMASLASRCSQLCHPMRPYTKAMYDAIGAYSTRHVRHSLISLAKVDVAVWIAFLLLSRLDSTHLSRPIASFIPRYAALVYKFDASLKALAIGVYYRVSEASQLILLAYTVIYLPFPTTEARKQNTFEYLCVSIRMLLTHML
jgi:hypothetical protein